MSATDSVIHDQGRTPHVALESRSEMAPQKKTAIFADGAAVQGMATARDGLAGSTL